MQRLACLLLALTAACGPDGADTGQASLTGVVPAPRSASASVFTDTDADGNQVMGWTIDFFEDGPGANCASADLNVVASIAIFTRDTPGSKPQPLLPMGDIPIVTQSPPSLTASDRVATMGSKNVAGIVGLVTIEDFRLTADAMHAQYIEGTVAAGGKDAGTGAGVLIEGPFHAPYCDL